ncbi:hypothetical protein, partial [Thiolapillus sp.]|uniref:hypothetical protein n=2 Tax=Thiolapillus sp. TaxID=2017437 RepID=UPI0025D86797
QKNAIGLIVWRLQIVAHGLVDIEIAAAFRFDHHDQACLRPRDRFWDIPVPKIDSAFDNLFVPQPSWSPSTTQQLRKLVAAPYLSPNDWTPRSNAYFASPLALCARAASRLLGTTSLRFALHGWQQRSVLKSSCSRKWRNSFWRLREEK